MNSTELLDVFRTEMHDIKTPQLCGDTEIYAFIDDAQTWFCRLTDGIPDSRTPAVTKLNIVPGTDWYDTNVKIRQIRKATRSDTGMPVTLYTAEQANTIGITFSHAVTGDLKAMVVGLETHALRVVPMPVDALGVSTVSSGITAINTAVVPIADTTGILIGMGLTATSVPVGTTVLSIIANTSVTLSANVTAEVPLGATLAFGLSVELAVYRFPLITITDDGDQALEIDDQHHTALLHWMKSRAYDKQDAETFDRRKSEEFRTRFTEYCARAQQEQQRARRVQGNVAYGGVYIANPAGGNASGGYTDPYNRK
jgi:hypothetical protein